MVNIHKYLKQEDFKQGKYLVNPILNESFVGFNSFGYNNQLTLNPSYDSSSGNLMGYYLATDLIDYFKRNPHVISVLSALVTDVVSDGYNLDGRRVNVDKAKKFLKRNYFNKLIESLGYDYFITGNAFFWKNSMDIKQIRKFMDKYYKQSSSVSRSISLSKLQYKSLSDELSNELRSIIHIPSSTMRIYPSDIYGSSYIYKQVVGSYESIFPEENIAHFVDIPLDGKKWGFARFLSILNHLDLYNHVLRHQKGYFKNKPGLFGMYIMKDKSPDSPDYKKFLDQLRVFKNPDTHNSTLLSTGDVDFREFSRMKDMEFKTLGEWVADSIAILWQVPPSRYGRTDTRGSDKELSNQAYYRNISHIQSKWEDILNTELFEDELKVTFEFNRSYREDEVREATTLKIKADFVQQALELGLISLTAGAKFLGIEEKDRPSSLGKPQIEILRSRSKISKTKGSYGQRDNQSLDFVMHDTPEYNSRKKSTPKSVIPKKKKKM